MKNKNNWRKPWHGVVRNFFVMILEPYIKRKYHVTVEKLERVYVGKQLNGDESWAYELRMK